MLGTNNALRIFMVLSEHHENRATWLFFRATLLKFRGNMTQVSGEMTLGRLDRLPWISSYCASCIYQQNITVRLFSLLTYEDGHSAAMKHVKHISCLNKLVEAIHYIIQNKQQCQAIEYDIQFICCSREISEKEGKNMVRKHRKKHVTDGMEPVAKKRFVE